MRRRSIDPLSVRAVDEKVSRLEHVRHRLRLV